MPQHTSRNPFQSDRHMHIGKLIKAEMQRRGLSAIWLSQQICCERTNIYNIYGRASIDTDLLLRISSVLQHNFFAELSAHCARRLNSRSRHSS